MPAKIERVYQRPWTPTKRRGPIAAEFSSPGPAVILLPSTFGPNSRDARVSKSPAFTFGQKIEAQKSELIPGPGEYEVLGVTRLGRTWSPSAFVSHKFKEPEKFNTPPPGHYEVAGLTSGLKSGNDTNQLYRKGKIWAPCAFVSPKFKDPEPFQTPPPGAYNPDKSARAVKEQAPSFSFGTKIPPPKPFNTPPPGAYNPERSTNLISTHTQAPAFSIGIKPVEENQTIIPGPGSYNLPETEAYKTRSNPNVSFGIRHSPYAWSY